MTTTTQPKNVLLLFVYDYIAVLEVFGATSCSFRIIDGVSYGYQYVKPEDFEDNLSRAYDILFNETFEHLKSKGVHLSL